MVLMTFSSEDDVIQLRSMKNRQMIEFRVKWRTHSNQGTNDDISKNLPNHLIWRHNQWPKKVEVLGQAFSLDNSSTANQICFKLCSQFLFEYWGICEWDRFIQKFSCFSFKNPFHFPYGNTFLTSSKYSFRLAKQKYYNEIKTQLKLVCVTADLYNLAAL